MVTFSKERKSSLLDYFCFIYVFVLIHINLLSSVKVISRRAPRRASSENQCSRRKSGRTLSKLRVKVHSLLIPVLGAHSRTLAFQIALSRAADEETLNIERVPGLWPPVTAQVAGGGDTFLVTLAFKGGGDMRTDRP